MPYSDPEAKREGARPAAFLSFLGPGLLCVLLGLWLTTSDFLLSALPFVHSWQIGRAHV